MLWDWLIGSVPPWVWLVLFVAAALIVAAVLKQGGWKWVAGLTVAGLGAYFTAKSYHRGVNAERAKQTAADEKARTIIAEKKEDVRTVTPEERSRRFNRWTKP